MATVQGAGAALVQDSATASVTEGQGLRHLDRLGAFAATAIFVLTIPIFISRLAGEAAWEYWLGVMLVLAALPRGYLLFRAPEHRRSNLYYLRVGLLLAFLTVEFVLDYALKSDFRRVRWMSGACATLFFAGTGGMTGVWSEAGRPWAISSILLYLIMAVLAVAQHVRYGR